MQMEEEVKPLHLVRRQHTIEASGLRIELLGLLHGNRLSSAGMSEASLEADGIGEERQDEIQVLLQELGLLRIQLLKFSNVFDNIADVTARVRLGRDSGLSFWVANGCHCEFLQKQSELKVTL
jgi:hypothetical protein